MSTKFFSTNNRRWYPVHRPNGKPGSERMELYGWIAAQPGIGSADLQALWTMPTSMRSRLKELEDAGFIRSEMVSDLFISLSTRKDTSEQYPDHG